ncbi:MAG TPA: YetF domain-containing protein [Gemmatimonadaceae bacterium]
MIFAAIDWHNLFVPQESILELVLRGTVMYLAIFAALRIFRRAAGTLGTADLLLLVLIADAAQNAMSAQYHSITEGAVLVGTIIAWNVVIDWLEFRFEFARRMLEPAPVPLIRNGRISRQNLRSEMITLDELHQHLREQGIEEASEVKRCHLEPDGKLSVITYGQKSPQRARKRSGI